MSAHTFTVFGLIFIAMVTYYYPEMVNKIKTKENPQPEYDFIIIGAGSAGSAVTGRLSEVKEWKVAVFEAGGQETVFSRTPLLWWDAVESNKNWKFNTTRQENACLETDGICLMTRGKVLGGSSSINGMLYMRGVPKDYDTWAEMGAAGWSYKDVRKFFLKSENMRDEKLAKSPYHNKGGPLNVQKAKYSPLATDDIIKAGIEIGMKDRDYNGEHPSAITKPQLTLKDIYRWSSSSAYLSPAKERNNLDVFIHAFVTKILIDPVTKRANGIEYVKDGKTRTVKARKEVILSAGSINSPKILMLSGVGKKNDLEKLGIQTISDLPVGDNYQDQTKIQMLYKFKGDAGITLNSHLTGESIAEYVINKTGPLSTNALDVIMLYNTGDNIATDNPDTSCHVYFANVTEQPPNASVITFFTTFLHVHSRGQVLLTSTDPNVPPSINPNYFSDIRDLNKSVEGMAIIDKLIKTEALKKYEPEWYLPGTELCAPLFSNFDEFLKCVAKSYSSTLFHPVGSAKMGSVNDSKAVLTPDLKVKGIANLRVIDGSIIPKLPSGDPNAIIIMIGEKGADIIKKQYNK